MIKKSGWNLRVGNNVILMNSHYLALGNNCFIDDNTFINAKGSFGISIGDNVTLNRNCYFNCFGERKGEGISVGNDVTIGNNAIIYGSALVSIGDNTAIGPNVVIVPENHNFKNPHIPIRKQGITKKRIIVEENVWIGSNCIILAGVTIHSGAVVGASSVVTKDVQKNTVVAGVPAKKIKDRV